MHAKSDNVELMSYDNVNDINDKLFESLDIKVIPKHQWKEVILLSIQFNNCIINVTE